MGSASRALLQSLLSVVLLGSAPGHARELDTPRAGPRRTPDSLAVLRREAERLELARHPGWLRLLHHRASVFGGTTSDLADPRFFLAREGADDPEAELLATLDALLRAPSGEPDSHARCRFPARVAWLTRRLPLPPSPVECPRLDAFLSEATPRAVSFVYASSSLEHPAAAIGHTFLLLEGRGASSAIDYRATTDTGNPLLYAFKGVAGLFVGRFEIGDGDAAIRNFLEEQDRDLWRLELALSDDELRLFALHLWELSPTETPYYYLSGNCSHHALAALEASAPRLRLVGRTKIVVFPIDAARAVLDSPGLVRRVSYLPARSSRELADSTRSPSRELGDSTRSPSRELGDSARSSRELEASEHSPPGEPGASERPSPHPPLVELPATGLRSLARSHGPLRLHGGSGWSSTGGALLNLGFRFALHDLLDPPAGYPDLLQIEFLGVSGRYALATQSFTIDRVSFFDLWSLRPLATHVPLTWRVRAFGDRARDTGCAAEDCFIHGLELGVGLAWATPDRALTLFAMAQGSTVFSGSLDGVDGSFVRLGIGPHGGVRLRWGSRATALVGLRWTYLPWQTLSSTFDASAELRLVLARDVALGAAVRAQPSATEATLSSYFYF